MVGAAGLAKDGMVLARLPRRAVLPAVGVVGLVLVVLAPLTFGAGGLLGGGGGQVVPTVGTGTPICLLGCPPAPTAASAPAPTTPAPASAQTPATAASRPSSGAQPAGAGPAPSSSAPEIGPTDQPVQQPVDQVTQGLPIVPTLPLGLPPFQPPGAPS
jgi:hypothetical protein